jgi:hypothetical protein
MSAGTYGLSAIQTERVWQKTWPLSGEARRAPVRAILWLAATGTFYLRWAVRYRGRVGR